MNNQTLQEQLLEQVQETDPDLPLDKQIKKVSILWEGMKEQGGLWEEELQTV